ncbi:bile acid:sodium symporter [Opitutaceae bacterium EW11]|nr:bile acid:sodium symporter [Opitutaceae bacterium EW11]
MKLKFDWFLLGLVAAVVAASVYPHLGAREGILHPELTNKLGVALIFLLHGIGLSFQALKAGTLHWRLHLLVQCCTFVLFPLLGGALYLGLSGSVERDLRIGIFFLCALPSTVSSSVAMTAAARGNVAAALFNATISSLLGVVITPLWVSAVTAAGETGSSLGGVVLDLCRWLVLPLVIGQLLRPWLATWVNRHKSGVHVVDRMTILFLVYTSFCDSVLEGVWSSHGARTILFLVVLSAALFAVVMVVSAAIGRRLGFDSADRIAAMFCASKKSMATGVPMAQLMFGGGAILGMVVLPVLIYHALQLVLAGILAARWSRRPA